MSDWQLVARSNSLPLRHSAECSAMIFRESDGALISAGRDGAILRHCIRTEQTTEIARFESGINSISIARDAPGIFALLQNGELHFFDEEHSRSRKLHEFGLDSYSVIALTRTTVLVEAGLKLHRFDVVSGQCSTIGESVGRPCVSPDGSMIVRTCTEWNSATMVVHDAVCFSELASVSLLEIDFDDGLPHYTFNRNSRQIFAATGAYIFHYDIDARQGRYLATAPIHGVVTDLLALDSGEHLVLCTRSSGLVEWRSALSDSPKPMTSVLPSAPFCFARCGRDDIVAAGYPDGSIIVADVKTSRIVAPTRICPGIRSICSDGDGGFLTGHDRSLIIQHNERFEEVGRYELRELSTRHHVSDVFRVPGTPPTILYAGSDASFGAIAGGVTNWHRKSPTDRIGFFVSSNPPGRYYLVLFGGCVAELSLDGRILKEINIPNPHYFYGLSIESARFDAKRKGLLIGSSFSTLTFVPEDLSSYQHISERDTGDYDYHCHSIGDYVVQVSARQNGDDIGPGVIRIYRDVELLGEFEVDDVEYERVVAGDDDRLAFVFSEYWKRAGAGKIVVLDLEQGKIDGVVQTPTCGITAAVWDHAQRRLVVGDIGGRLWTLSKQ